MDELFTRYMYFIRSKQGIKSSTTEALRKFYEKGKHAILNRGNQIGHDCVIGDYFSMMPGAIVSGNVKIYDLVYMGCNSSIREKLSIHSLCTIGMGAAVVSNINDGNTYVGVPAKKYYKKKL